MMTLSRDDIFVQMQQIIPFIKHCELLGIDVLDAGKGCLTLALPYSDEIVGNTDTGVIHGGALTTLMDTACGFAAMSALEVLQISPTLDLRIDYMCQAQPGKAVIGEAEAYRVTRSVIFTRGIAYHEGEKDQPIAHCSANFMRLDPEVVSPTESQSEK